MKILIDTTLVALIGLTAWAGLMSCLRALDRRREEKRLHEFYRTSGDVEHWL